jgi:hypothetical protein
MTTVGLARLIGASKHTVYSWRRADREACEWEDWRERVIAGLQTEIDRLRKGQREPSVGLRVIAREPEIVRKVLEDVRPRKGSRHAERLPE